MTEDPHNNEPVLDSYAHCGTKALIQLMHRERLPNAYVDDVAIDIDLLYRKQPRCFVVVLRENGSDIGLPNLKWSQERVEHMGKQSSARVFTVAVTETAEARSFTIERRTINGAMDWLRRQEVEESKL